MKEKLSSLISDVSLRQQYGQAGRQDFENRFFKAVVIDKWFNILKSDTN